MKKISVIALLFAFVFNAFAQEIKFETGTWAEIKAKAKKENKLIFMDAYTTWCGPCKMMAKNTFTDKAVADYYNSTFINAKIDMEKGEGLDIAKEYKITCYPNLVYIDGDGKLVHRAAGSMEPADFINLGKTAYTPAKAFSAYQDKYDKGDRNPEFLIAYLDALSQTCFSTSNVATDYFASVKEQDMLLPANWSILYHHIDDVNSTPFTYFVKHKKDFEAKFTADSVNQKIVAAYLANGNAIIKSTDNVDEKLKGLIGQITKLGIDGSEEIIANLNLSYASSKKDWNAYFNAAKILADKHYANDANFLNNVSWTAFEKISDKKQLEEAELWAKRSTEISAGAYNLDTYANLLFKNGKKEQAIATEKKALELAKAQGEDIKPYEDTIASFQK